MNNQITKHKIDLDTISYQISLHFAELTEEFIKEKLGKTVLSDYDIDALTDLFKNVLTVGKSSDLDKNYLSLHKIKYCLSCGSENNKLISKNDGFTYQCKNENECKC